MGPGFQWSSIQKIKEIHNQNVTSDSSIPNYAMQQYFRLNEETFDSAEE